MSLPWDQNWERSYRISIGTREYKRSDYTVQELKAIPTSLQRPSLAADSITVPSNAVVMSNLIEDGFNRRGFSFNFNSTNKLSQKGGDAENSSLDIINPNQDLIDIMNQDKCVVIIEMGYQQKVSLEYSGDVVSVKSRQSGADTIYTLRCASGALAMRNTLVNLHYDESVSEQDLIIDMVGRFSGTALGTYGLEEFSDRYKTGGRNFTGSLITNFDKLMTKHNLSYAHLNGKIVIVPFRFRESDRNKFMRTNYDLDAQSIKKVTDVSKRGDIGTDTVESKLRTLQLNSFYFPVELGQFVTIPSEGLLEEYAGTYLVKAKRTIASTTGGAWDVVIEIESLP